MKSLLFKPPKSNVTHIIQYTDEADFLAKLELQESTGEILCCDANLIRVYWFIGYQHVALNHETVYEITEIQVDEPNPAGESEVRS